MDREAGVRPARTRHCDRGCRAHAAREGRIHWAATCGPGRSVRSARKPGDLPPTAKPRSPRGRGGSQMHKFLSGLAAGVALLIAAPGALAAPVTVDLRIEGPSRTLFEGPVTTDVRTFRFTGDPVSHRCDGTAAENHGTSPTPMPTRGAAVAVAAEQTPFAIRGDWFDSLGSPSFSEIDGESVAFDPARLGSSPSTRTRSSRSRVVRRSGRRRRPGAVRLQRRRRSAARARRPGLGEAGRDRDREGHRRRQRRARSRRDGGRRRHAVRTARRPSGRSRSAASRTSRRPSPARSAPTACACA